ncbi:unnamed protein product, partial [Iphiclides podalirius]
MKIARRVTSMKIASTTKTVKMIRRMSLNGVKKNGQDYCAQMSLDSQYSLMMEGGVYRVPGERYIKSCFA